MKHTVLAGILLIGAALSGQGQTAQFYVNNGVINATNPPQIDAFNFVNNNQFNVSLSGLSFNIQLFDTSSTINFTNSATGSMQGSPGFQFDTAPATLGIRHRAANFVNEGTISAGSATNTIGGILGNFITINGGGSILISPGLSEIVASATNIVMPGTATLGTDGLLKFDGNNINLSRGTISMEGFEQSPFQDFFQTFFLQNIGIFDNYWGVGNSQKIFPQSFFNSLRPVTPVHSVTQLVAGVYLPFSTAFQLPNAKAYVNDFFTDPTNELVEVCFISNTNSAISNRVFFNLVSLNPAEGEIVVEWSSAFANPVSSSIATNYLYLFDTLESATNLIVLTNNFFLTDPNPSFIPTNFVFTRDVSPRFDPAFATPPTQPPLFPAAATNRYSAYSAFFRPTTQIRENVLGQAITNLPGRIEIKADDYLDLTDSRIAGLNYILLKATNHFAGSRGANIVSPFIDIDLAATNGLIAVTNLLQPNVPRFTGEVDLYAANWTNIDQSLTPPVQTVYHVLFVNSQLAPGSPPEVQDLKLRATSVTVSDELNVDGKLLIDAEQLTITTNAPDAVIPAGQINLLSGDIIWSSATPRLKFFTNNGTFTAANTVFFGGARTSPNDITTPSDWYEAFVNTGLVIDQGSFIWANYFENSGILNAGLGSITLQSQNALLTNGTFVTPGVGLISISSGSLVVSNHSLLAGGALTLSITNVLDDGSLVSRVELITNKNFWAVGSGMQLPILPTHSSLLSTTITNTAVRPGDVRNIWAAHDLGCSPAGFVDNAAVGRLILDAPNAFSSFSFASAGGKSAIYIDQLDLVGAVATNTDVNGHYVGLRIDPNMTVYFAQATANGLSIAEKLNGDFGATGASGGRFCWVSNYNCGPFSSILFTNGDGSVIRVNSALVESCDIDSDGDGIVNCKDPSPFPLPLPACGEPPFPGGLGLARVFGNGGGSFGSSGLPVLSFPASRSLPGGTLSNAFASASGAYSGLFYDTNGVTSSSAGYFSATATARGGYSARLMLGGRTYAFSGAFDPVSGMATQKVKRLGSTPLTVRLQLDLTGGEQIRGSVSDGNWKADLLADRLVYNRVQNKATQAGQYTLVIPAGENAGGPAGHSVGTVKVDAGGTVLWTGTMADGTKAAQKSALSRDGIWPMYASLYGGRGAVVSWVQFSNENQSDLEGQLVWLKPAGVTGKYYPGGFTNAVGAIGSLYAAPVLGAKALETNTRDLVFSDGGFDRPLIFPLLLGANNKVTNLGTNKLTLTVTSSSGLFRGTAFNPETRKNFSFQGVLLEKRNDGAGFFLGTNQSGQVYLAPPGN